VCVYVCCACTYRTPSLHPTPMSDAENNVTAADKKPVSTLEADLTKYKVSFFFLLSPPNLSFLPPTSYFEYRFLRIFLDVHSITDG